LEADTWEILIIRLPDNDESREHVESEGFITLNKVGRARKGKEREGK
jgi:hypothetical protein